MPQAGVSSVEMLLDAGKIKAQASRLGEPVTFRDREAEDFLREVEHGPSSDRQEQLRAAVKAAAAVEATSMRLDLGADPRLLTR